VAFGGIDHSAIAKIGVEVLRRYILSRHSEQIAEFVEVESAEHNDRPPLGP